MIDYTYVNDIYKENSVHFSYIEVDGLHIPWKTQWTKVGINLSGGADSALLAYLLCKHIQATGQDCKVDAISLLRCWETRPWQRETSLKIFNKLKDMFPDIIDMRHTSFVPPEIEHSQVGNSIVTKAFKQPLAGEAIISYSFNKYTAYTYNLGAIFNALTANPPNAGPIRVPERDLDKTNLKLRDTLQYIAVDKKSFYTLKPLRYVMKDFVYKQYVDNDILELYHATGSCEGDLKIHNATKEQVPTLGDYTPGMTVEPCNDCWWCWERKWAEDQCSSH